VAFQAAGEAFGAVVEADPVAGVVHREVAAVAVAREGELVVGLLVREAVPGVRAREASQEALVGEPGNNVEALKEVEPVRVVMTVAGGLADASLLEQPSASGCAWPHYRLGERS